MSPHSRRASSASLTEPEQPRHIIHTLPRLTDRVKNLTSLTLNTLPHLTDHVKNLTSHHPPRFTSSHRPCQEPDVTDTQMFIMRNKCLFACRNQRFVAFTSTQFCRCTVTFNGLFRDASLFCVSCVQFGSSHLLLHSSFLGWTIVTAFCL